MHVKFYKSFNGFWRAAVDGKIHPLLVGFEHLTDIFDEVVRFYPHYDITGTTSDKFYIHVEYADGLNELISCVVKNPVSPRYGVFRTPKTFQADAAAMAVKGIACDADRHVTMILILNEGDQCVLRCDIEKGIVSTHPNQGQGVDELPPFDDPKVQIVYTLLTDDQTPPDKSEHWEGWVARRICAALARTP